MNMIWADPRRFGIRARLLTLLLPGILGLLALDSWNDYRALRNLVHDAYDEAMLDAVNVLQKNLALAPDGSLQMKAPLVVQAMLDTTSPKEKYLHVGLTPRPTGQAMAATPLQALTLLGNADLPAAPGARATAGASSSVWYDSDYRGKPVRVVALQRQVSDGHGQLFDLLVQAAESTGPREQAQAASLRQELIRDARMLLVVIVLVWLGVRWSLQPLEQLRKSVLQNKGKDLQLLDTGGVPHEVAPLVEAVNLHVASYRALLDRQSQFLADASHQLRTPLAIMLTQAGVALREKDPEFVRQTLRAIVTQIARSRRLCEQLLSLAHAHDAHLPGDAPSPVDLNAIAKDVVLQYLALAHEKDQDLGWIDALDALAPKDCMHEAHCAASVPAQPVVPVLADGAELHEALANLVHNAIAYTPAGGQITVMVTMQGGMALAQVSDSGPGIAGTRREEVFERFHHAGNAPHGAGLGLAIARAYARRNGGDIALSDAPADSARVSSSLAGLRATLRIPIAPDSRR